jgi:hypothetical protein
MTLSELKIFSESLGYTESGGDYYNETGSYWGKYQFGEARRKDIEQMLGLHHLNRTEFTPDVQEIFFRTHVNDIEQKIFLLGLDKYFDRIVEGKGNKIVTQINKCGLIAGAHLGGFVGMKNFLTSNYSYDPKDSNGTYISDYVAKFSELTEKKNSIFNLAGLNNPIIIGLFAGLIATRIFKK